MIKGILFDKDGTLIDFSLWRNAGIETIKNILKENEIEDEELFNALQRSIGITENGVEPFGALSYKTHDEVAAELHFLISKYKNIEFVKFKKRVSQLLRDEVLREDVVFKPITDLHILFDFLKDNDIKVGLATADTMRSAMHMIDKLKLHDKLDFIGAHDGTTKQKPHQETCEKFCNMYSLKPSEVAVIGDTYSDMLFAKNCNAIAIGVLSGVSSEYNLRDVADIIVPSIESLFNLEFLNSIDKGKIVKQLWTA